MTNNDFEFLKEEISKETIDKKKCNQLIYSIEYDFDEQEEKISDLESNIIDLEEEISNLEKSNELNNQSMLDNYFKDKLFTQLSEKYTWYQLEEKLKNII